MTSTKTVAGRPDIEGPHHMKHIADLLDRVGHGDAWHGSSVDAILDGVTARQAVVRPLTEAHTIWELVLHIAVWSRVVARRLGGTQIDPTPAEDWPSLSETTEDAWRAAVEDLRRAREELRAALLAFDGHRLDETVPGKTYSFYVMAHGIIQHDLYHAGQIALLKKVHP
jgi:hypothetical protein